MSSIISNAKNKEKCQKFTPDEVVTSMLDLADYNHNLFGKRILEYSFGSGNILKAIVKRYIEDALSNSISLKKISEGLARDIYGIELDKELFLACVNELNEITNRYQIPLVKWSLLCEDTLHWKTEDKFDFIIGNPPSEGYKSLLKNASVLTSNIILIDSRLFEDRTASEGKFSGEEFKIILKKYYPFIEVIVITQNGADESVKTLPKYSSDFGKAPDEYYDSVLPQCINEAIEQNRIYRNLAKRMSENDSWEPILKEKVIGTLEGTGTYDELTKEDIDTLVCAFKEILEKYDE